MRPIFFEPLLPPRLRIFAIISPPLILHGNLLFRLYCLLFPILFNDEALYDRVSQGCHHNLVPPGKDMNGSYACEMEHLHQFSLKPQSHAAAWPDFLVRVVEL